MNEQTIITNIQHSTGIIHLNRPKTRNAISIQMRKEIIACLTEWKSSDDVRAVIISGIGSVFSAGYELDEFGKPQCYEELLKTSTDYHLAVCFFPKPVIAAVNGPAIGGGFDLATLCGIRICSETALFAHPEVKLGAPP